MASQPEINLQCEASRKIDQLLDLEQQPRDRLGQLCRAMLTHQGADLRNLSNSDVVSRVLSPSPSGRDQQFFAAVFLRLLSVLPKEVHDLDNNLRLGVTRLLEKVPKVAQVLGIDKKSQSFERMRALESGAEKAEAYLKDRLAPPRQLMPFDKVRQRIMPLYSNSLVREIIGPFLPDFLSRSAVGVILETIHDYVTAQPRVSTTKYMEAKERLEEVLKDCTRYDTHFVTEFFQPFFKVILDHLEKHFESSSVNLPGTISLRDRGRKYSLAVPEIEVRLTFVVENIGAGTAFDVELSIEVDDCLSVHSPSQYFDCIDSGKSFEPVEFLATVATASDESVLVQYSLKWTNGDGSSGESEDFLELQTQPRNIPWEDLEYADPYSLEPVRNATDLIGRSEQTRQLISKIKAPSIGSFCIYGQRRVGKTSVVAALESMPEVEDITILYLDTGGFIVPDARETVNKLGRKICTLLLQRKSLLSGLPVPNFDGALSPLDDFLSSVLERDPDLRLVIVLDEFDALPPQLYRKGEISHALFMTLRSLSARDPVGFILVGGETMSEILSTQGEILNKFRPLRIDYMEKESQWSDFVELVRRPVAEWATITDDAIIRLYEVTAGNPFFTKFVCSELVADMKRRRDAYVTSVEMDLAIRIAVEGAGINHFQHFWDDGVVATTQERIDEERASRRRIMVALGEVIRSQKGSNVDNISKKASRFGIDETEVLRILTDSEKRKILVKVEDEYACKVRLFERWLVDKGVNELGLSLVEEESLCAELKAEEEQRVKKQEINTLVNGWENYRGKRVTDIAVESWLNQFDTTEEQRVAFSLLKEIRFYSGALIREKLRSAHKSILADLAGRGVVRRAADEGARKVTDNILISFYGGEGKRGQTYAKLYADENKIYQDRITSPERLRDQVGSLTDVKGIVFVDDFIGSGRTARASLKDALSPIADIVKKLGIDVFLISISGFALASEKVERELAKVVHGIRVSVCDPLNDSDRCFSETSVIFSDQAKRARAKEIVESYGRDVSKRNPLGFGNCQALVVFEHTCPNNSLPILWASGPDDSWHPLFPRP